MQGAADANVLLERVRGAGGGTFCAFERGTARQQRPIRVLHRCQDYLVIDKPCDLRLDGDHEQTVEKQVMLDVPTLPRDQKLRWVHQLDYATSGVLCIALTKPGAARASKLFAARLTSKIYLALLQGRFEKDVFECSERIADDPTHPFRMAIGTDQNPGRAAHTRAQVLGYGNVNGKPVTKVMLKPQSGRRHQLRLHSMHMGHAIVGDATYGGDVVSPRMMLHAWRLALPFDDFPELKVETVDPFATILTDYEVRCTPAVAEAALIAAMAAEPGQWATEGWAHRNAQKIRKLRQEKEQAKSKISQSALDAAVRATVSQRFGAGDEMGVAMGYCYCSLPHYSNTSDSNKWYDLAKILEGKWWEQSVVLQIQDQGDSTILSSGKGNIVGAANELKIEIVLPSMVFAAKGATASTICRPARERLQTSIEKIVGKFSSKRAKAKPSPEAILERMKVEILGEDFCPLPHDIVSEKGWRGASALRFDNGA